MLDVDQPVGIAPEKTDHAILRVHGDAVAICVLLRRRDDRPHRDLCEFADSLERIPHLSPFDRELMFVTDVLVGTATASAEIGALWCNAIRRTLFNFDQVRFSELFLFAHDFGRNQLPSIV